MKTIAITGGIGSGKSAVSSILRNLGYCVWDADIFARLILENIDVQNKIKSCFGDDIFLENGNLDRARVRHLILENKQLKKQLEDITHPAIRQYFLARQAELAKIVPNAWVFYEAALIIETNQQNNFDACILITADENTKIERLKQRNNFSQEEALKLISSQLPDSVKKEKATEIIDNSSHKEDLEKQVLKLLAKLSHKFHGNALSQV